MTSRLLLATLSSALVLVSAACRNHHWVETPTSPGDLIVGSGNLMQEIRSVSAFDAVRLEGIGSVEITAGSEEALIVEAEDNLLPYLRTQLVGRALVISTDPTVNLQPKRPIAFRVAVRSIDRIDLVGVGNIRCTGIAGDVLTISDIGVGNIDCFEVALHGLNVDIVGTGSVSMSGTTTNQRINLTGVGSYDGRNLQSAQANVSLQSVGSATVRVADRLTARVVGSGCVFYIGDPQLDSSVTGTGCVSKID